MDTNTLFVGNIDELMLCAVIYNTNNNKNGKKKAPYKVAGALDLHNEQWNQFNTGSILYSTSNNEMNRIYALTKIPSFMRKFQSDQVFTNELYSDRKISHTTSY